MNTVMVLSEEELKFSQIKSDGVVNDQIYRQVEATAKKWGVPIEAIAILGGKPYPMQAALFKWLKDKLDVENLAVTMFQTKTLLRAEQQNVRAGFECWITLLDMENFYKTLELLPEKERTVEAVKELRGLFSHTYREEAWASPQSVRMKPLHNADYINHMAQTRAVDRCLRIITRCPFTAASELPDGEPGGPMETQYEAKEGVVDAEFKAKDAPTAPPPRRPVVDVNVPDEKKGEKISDQQIDIAMNRWREYVTARCPEMSKVEVGEKADKFIRAVFNKALMGDLTVRDLGEWLDMMERGDITITPPKTDGKK